MLRFRHALFLPLAMALGAEGAFSPDFSSDVRLSTDAVAATPPLPAVVPDGSGGSYVVCPTPYLTVQHLDASGELLWGPQGQRTSSIPLVDVGEVKACSDGQGGILVAWTDLFAQRASGRDVSAQRFGPAGPLWGDGGVLVCASPGTQNFPSIAPDGQGGAYVSWADYSTPPASLRAQRVAPNGQVLWQAAGISVFPYTAQPLQFYSRGLVPDGNGQVYVLWDADPGLGTFQDVFVQRLAPDGQFPWGPFGISATQAADALAPAAQHAFSGVPDGSGGLVLGWYTGSSLVLQRIAPDGRLRWGPGTSVANRAALPGTLVPDGAGGGLLTWRELLTDNAFAQRVDAQGVPRWGSLGTLLSTYVVESSGIPCIGDGSGGLVACWASPDPSFRWIVRAQRLDAQGQSLWGAAGVQAASFSSRILFFLGAAEDGEGGAVLATVGSSSDPYAYASRILPSGERGAAVSGVVRYGRASGGCATPASISVAGIPLPGQAFRVTCAKAPPLATGYLLVGVRRDLAGTPLHGVTLHVDLSRPHQVLPATSNESGGALTALPLPAGTSGRSFCCQYVWACPQGGYAASDAIGVTLR